MFRFTIRDVLWLTVVVGMGLAWYSHFHSWHVYYSRLHLSEISRIDPNTPGNAIKLTVENARITNENHELLMEIARLNDSKK